VWWIQPLLTVVLGAALGVYDLNAPGASNWLRVPALIAALILVAQGLLDLENARRARQMRLPAPEGSLPGLNPTPPPVLPVVQDDTTLLEEEEPTAHSAIALEQAVQAQAAAARLVAGTAVRESRGAVVLVMLLSVWLGLATLSFSTAPRELLTLSLIAAFLLFASTWSTLQKPPA
jgi:hypothetical protein